MDTALFFDGALTGEPTTVDCTLNGGATTTCYHITVAGYPTSHEVGPFCPSKTTDGADKGTGGYNPVRGDKVIAFARKFLNDSLPLAAGSWTEVRTFAVVDGALVITLADESTTTVAALKSCRAVAGVRIAQQRRPAAVAAANPVALSSNATQSEAGTPIRDNASR